MSALAVRRGPAMQQNHQQRDDGAARRAALSLANDIDLASLATLLEEKQAEHAAVQRELDASNAALELLVRQSRESLAGLQQRARQAKESFSSLYADVSDFHDEIYSPLSARSASGRGGPAGDDGGPAVAGSSRNNNARQHTATLFETLQAIHTRIQSLTRARDLFAHLAKAEELSLIAKEQVKLPTPEAALESYVELVQQVHRIHSLGQSASHHGSLASAPFADELARATQRDLTRALEAKLVSTLDALGWPGKKLQPDELDYEASSPARAFKAAFFDLCKLEKSFNANPLPGSSRQSSTTSDLFALAISALAQPLILRFRYHFDGKRQTNRLDKPEWYFAHILNALTDHAAFVRHDVQRLLSQGGLKQVDAMTDFITALLRPLHRKIRASIPQLLELPSILAHTIYQALQFDASLRETYAYVPRAEGGGRMEAWKGTADVLLGNKVWFEGWKEAERKFVDDKFFEIISATDAWHVNEDYAVQGPSAVQPTNSAIRVRDLFDQVTDRYRPLPDFEHRLPFLVDIQLPLLENYLGRISSATDAFETLSFGLMRAVPGTLAGAEGSSARLTNGLNGLQRLLRAYVSATWMQSVCKEWSEDLFFLDLWQDIRERSLKDLFVRTRCKKLLDYVPASKPFESTPSMFDVFSDGFGQLADRISDLTVKHVVREISTELKAYLGLRWDEATFPAPSLAVANGETPEGPSEISPELASPVTVLSALLSSLASFLPALPLNKLYRQITYQLQEPLLARGVYPKIWSERGGMQFRYDVEQGWLAAVREATKGKVRKPEIGLRKLLDAAILVSLHSSTSVSSPTTNAERSAGLGGENVPIARVVQVAWDDTNDAAFNEMLMKLGVRELVGRKDVKAILRKRPECWR